MPAKLPVTAVVCVKNSANTIEDCLRAIKENNVDEIIVVDGLSKDRSVVIAEEYADTIISDEGKGISHARVIGTNAARNDLIAMISPDDILELGSLKRLIEDMQENNWVGVRVRPRILLTSRSTYWDRCWDYTQERLARPGPTPIIGFSSLFQKKILLKYIDETFTVGEDTDICERMRADGLAFGIGHGASYENQSMDHGSFKKRMQYYGAGDAIFIEKWMRIRPRIALRHFFHPLRNYIIGQSFRAALDGRFEAILFFILFGIYRYDGMFRQFLRLPGTYNQADGLQKDQAMAI